MFRDSTIRSVLLIDTPKIILFAQNCAADNMGYVQLMSSRDAPTLAMPPIDHDHTSALRIADIDIKGVVRDDLEIRRT